MFLSHIIAEDSVDAHQKSREHGLLIGVPSAFFFFFVEGTSPCTQHNEESARSMYERRKLV
jgi:hypothetical protein